jgi:hypothetical protein
MLILIYLQFLPGKTHGGGLMGGFDREAGFVS